MGATGLKCKFFFFKFVKSPWREKKGGPVARWGGDRLPLSYFNSGYHSPPFPLSFEPKNSEKKERGEEKKSGEALPNCVLLIYR